VAFSLLLALVLVGGPKPVVIKANCKPVQVKEFEITACLKGGKRPSSYVATFATDGGTPIVVEQPFEPDGTFDGTISFEQANARYLAYTSDDFECTIAFIIDRQTGKVVAESGCMNAKYCSVKKMPGPDDCQVAFSCGEGTDPRGYDTVWKSWCPKKK
jgi:hypothetical protein